MWYNWKTYCTFRSMKRGAMMRGTEELLELLDKFTHSGACDFCGSQRCECSLEWALGCSDFKAFMNARKSDEEDEVSV